MENETENGLLEHFTVIYVFKNNICSPDKFVTKYVIKHYISVCMLISAHDQ